MLVQVWKAAADKVARYLREQKYTFHRGLLVIPRPHEGLVIAWIFGNDNYAHDTQAQREVDHLRGRLKENAIEELGFSLSPDGYSWVLVLKADSRGYATSAGKAFHLEMVRQLLDEAVAGAWQVSIEVCGRACNLGTEQVQPTP